MAWPKKIRSMTIEPAKNGMMSTIRPAGTKQNPYPDAALPTFHPTVAHLQAHIGKTFGGAKAPEPRNPLAFSTPKGAQSAGGAKLSPSPGQARIAASMLGGD